VLLDDENRPSDAGRLVYAELVPRDLPAMLKIREIGALGHFQTIEHNELRCRLA